MAELHSDDKRVNVILEAIASLAAGDFEFQLAPSGVDDSLDKIIRGVRKIASRQRSAPVNGDGAEAGRTLTENTLADSENQLRKVIEHIDEIVYRVAGDPVSGQLIFMSPRVEELTGYSPDDFYANRALWFDLIHPDDVTPANETINDLHDGQCCLTLEYRLRHRSSASYRWVEDRVVPQVDDQGDVTGILGFVRDITERKSTELELLKLSAAVEQGSDMVLITDAAGTIEYVNPRFCEVTGYTVDEVLGLKPSMLQSGQTHADVYDELWQTILAGNVWHGELYNKRKNGELYWARETISPIFNDDGEITHFLAIESDVTEEKALREAITSSEQKYRTLIEQAPDGIFLADRQGNFLDVNQQVCQLLGYAVDELCGMNIRELLSAGDAQQAPLRWAQRLDDNPLLTERCLRRKDGSLITVEISSKRLPDGNLQAIVRDITGRKQVEAAEQEQRLLAEALRDTAEAMNSSLELDNVLLRILENLKRVVAHDGAHIMLIEGDEARIVQTYGYEHRDIGRVIIDERVTISATPILQTMLTTKAPLVIHDVAQSDLWHEVVGRHSNWLTAYAGTPIVYDDEVLGFFNIGRMEALTWNDNLPARLQAFANQAAIAIRNAQLFEKEHKERLTAQTLRNTAEALVQSTDLKQTIQTVLGELEKLVAFEASVVTLIEDEELNVLAHNGIADKQLLESALKHEEFALYHDVLKLQNRLYVPDAQQESRWIDVGSDARSWLGIPLITSGTVLGMLAIASTKRDAFNSEDIATVTAFAQQASVAVRNAQVVAYLEDSLRELKQAQAHIKRTAKLTAAGEVAAGVAHQINNPLTAVIGRSHILLTELDPDHPAYETAEVIRQAAYRAGSIVQRMLDLARSHDETFEAVDINASIQSAIGLVHAQIESSTVHLRTDFSPQLPPIKASEQYLQDVWLNMLLNARDAIHDDDKPEHEIMVRTTYDAAERAIQVMIKDNGHGIPPDMLDRIFAPFVTTKEYGTGLGLAICHDVIANHGGSIDVESTVGQGTGFTISLPTV